MRFLYRLIIPDWALRFPEEPWTQQDIERIARVWAALG